MQFAEATLKSFYARCAKRIATSLTAEPRRKYIRREYALTMHQKCRELSI